MLVRALGVLDEMDEIFYTSKCYVREYYFLVLVVLDEGQKKNTKPVNSALLGNIPSISSN